MENKSRFVHCETMILNRHWAIVGVLQDVIALEEYRRMEIFGSGERPDRGWELTVGIRIRGGGVMWATGLF